LFDFFGSGLAPTQFGNAAFAPESFEYNTDFFFGRIMAPALAGGVFTQSDFTG
jgi:hypothetical protein